jgi:hypothetical protein
VKCIHFFKASDPVFLSLPTPPESLPDCLSISDSSSKVLKVCIQSRDTCWVWTGACSVHSLPDVRFDTSSHATFGLD